MRLGLWAMTAALAASAAVSVWLADVPRTARVSVETADVVSAGGAADGGSRPVLSFRLDGNTGLRE